MTRRGPDIASRTEAEGLLVEHVENLIGSCGRCCADTGQVTPAPCPPSWAAWRYLDILGLTP